MPAAELRALIESAYRWALEIDFDADGAQATFWYRSQEKQEPRLGLCGIDAGREKQMPLGIALLAQQCHRRLVRDLATHPHDRVADFLFRHPEDRGIVRRIQTMAATRYGEIRANLLDRDVLPMHLLRCKLSFFGVSKFDPRSRLWVRNTMFQGLPCWKISDTPLTTTGSCHSHPPRKPPDADLRQRTGRPAQTRLRRAGLPARPIRGCRRHGRLAAAAWRRRPGRAGVAGRPALPATELSAPAPGRLVARCHGRSALDALPSLLDLACLRASRQGRIQLEILDCRDRKCVLKLLADCARKGCWAQARWDDGDAPAHRHTAWIESGADYPSYQTAALPERGAAESPRSLTLTLDIEPLPAPVLEADAARIARRVTPADYAQAGRRALEHGTEVSPTLWQRLNRLAEAVLVENSEQSRSGAGGR